jgi:tetratricopeptide (TPR) repeat protein
MNSLTQRRQGAKTKSKNSLVCFATLATLRLCVKLFRFVGLGFRLSTLLFSAYCLLSSAYPFSQDPVAQAEEAVRLATVPSQKAAAYVALGRAYFTKGEEDKAEAALKSAIDLDPANVDAHLELGQLRVFQHKVPEAEAEFRQAVRVAPDSAAANATLAEVLLQTGRNAEARKFLEKAVSLDARDWHSQYRLATLLSDDLARATELLTNVTRLAPDFLPAREELGLALLRRGDSKAATALAEAMIAAQPKAAEGHGLMAMTLWKGRNFEASLAECAMALAADPNSSRMELLQALELWQMDRKKEAQQLFVHAAKKEPDLATAALFCRLLLCEARDVGVVDEFLRKNRWALTPREP